MGLTAGALPPVLPMPPTLVTGRVGTRPPRAALLALLGICGV